MAKDPIGRVLPGVRVEVVDDDGQLVIGEFGLIRVKGQGSAAYILMIRGHLSACSGTVSSILTI
jgi:hypothetical protein